IEDQDGETVDMAALEKAADYYLSHGILSWDHKHKQNNDPESIIGEPLEVKFTDDKKTLVKGWLYQHNDKAKKVWNNIRSGAERLGSSIGGGILRKASDRIRRVVWDEVAITHKPRNDGTLGSVSMIPFSAFAKAISYSEGGTSLEEFVKALTAGSGDEDEEEEEVDDKEAKGVKKSIDDFLAEDPEAEAAMDVSPFLAQLTKAVKAIEERVDGLQKSISDKMVGVETMLKAQGKATYLQMELQKSQRTTVELIAKEDREVGGMLRMRKSRFDGEGSVNIDGPTVLEKSREWVAEKKIDILEAGLIEQRVNKNSLGTYKDDLDSKVERLIKEAS
ncbi:hypothetical protein LCGC14_2658100, partial [marine sediment metagenome]